MSARHKLNEAYLFNIGIVAAIIGCLSQSWILFFGILVVMAMSALDAGQIRPNRSPR